MINGARLSPTLPTLPWWVGRAGVLAAVVVAGYWLSLASLWSDIGGQTPLAFVGLAPILAFSLLIAGLGRRSALPIPGGADLAVGLFLIALAGAIVLVAPSFASVYFWTARLDVASLPLFTAGALIMLFGWRVLFISRGALVLLLLAWPLPHLVLLENTSELLTVLTAEALEAFTNVVPVATAAAGSSAMFRIHNAEPFNVQVATACAGLNSTVAFLLVGGAFVMLLRGPVGRKFAWFAMGLVLVFLLNVVRVVALVVVGFLFGQDAAMDLFHPIAGTMALLAALVIMLFLLPRFGLRPPQFTPEAPVATPLPSHAVPARPGRRLMGRAAILAVIAVMFGAVNGTFAAYEHGDDFGSAGAVAEPLPDEPGTLGGLEVRKQREITIGRPYYGEDSSWRRFNTWARPQAPGSEPYRVWVDSVVAGDRQKLSDFGVEKCYVFHGHKITGAEPVALGSGVIGRVMSVTRAKTGSTWVVLWWEWPVLVGDEIHHERVVLFTSTSVRPSASEPQVDVPEPVLLLGEGIPITADLRPLVDDIAAHAHGIVDEQARRTAAAR